jgi:hypothetical protein
VDLVAKTKNQDISHYASFCAIVVFALYFGILGSPERVGMIDDPWESTCLSPYVDLGANMDSLTAFAPEKCSN